MSEDAWPDSDRLELLDGLAYEITEQIRNGQRPDLDEYVARYPQVADEIREMFPFLADLELTIGEVSTGTESSTVLVKDIAPGSLDSQSPFSVFNQQAQEMVDVNGTLYFLADDGTHGRELWKSDGTESGTVLVKDIRPGAASSNSGLLLNANGTLYFLADDGVHGAQLWKSDGTESGTQLVTDFAVGNWISELTDVNGTLFFRVFHPVQNEPIRNELWKSDGTSEGTVLVMTPTVSFPSLRAD